MAFYCGHDPPSPFHAHRNEGARRSHGIREKKGDQGGGGGVEGIAARV